MNKLNELMSRCKCGVYLSVNAHRDVYESVEDYTKDIVICTDDVIDDDILEKMIETNTIIELQYYPDTPIGFYKIYHYDLDMALDEALEDD